MSNLDHNSFVCPNGHTRENPETMICAICGGALKPDPGRGDITEAELRGRGLINKKPIKPQFQRIIPS